MRGDRGSSSAGREGGDPAASRRAANVLATDTWLSFWVPLRPLLPELQQKSHLLSWHGFLRLPETPS